MLQEQGMRFGAFLFYYQSNVKELSVSGNPKSCRRAKYIVKGLAIYFFTKNRDKNLSNFCVIFQRNFVDDIMWE